MARFSLAEQLTELVLLHREKRADYANRERLGRVPAEDRDRQLNRLARLRAVQETLYRLVREREPDARLALPADELRDLEAAR